MDNVQRLPGRREFLWGLPIGCLACGGCLQELNRGEQSLVTRPEIHKFDLEVEMTTREMFDLMLTKTWIPLMERLAVKVGREKLVQLLHEASSEAATEALALQRSNERPMNLDQVAAFYEDLAQAKPLQTAISFRITDKDDSGLGYEVSECLYAETFRKAKAEDLGYASFCFSDYSLVKGLNPDLKLERPQVLMRGDSCCRARISFEA